ncbi:hypothetical protein [Rufibacter sp. LB8]|uniref:hypothetical protein n=1 Tax=Rufibacter sp. LB8 TaxID=2777781 RepID=UPI00178C447E|nr:hypothetical protein [Rufibacter sp. LB8]
MENVKKIINVTVMVYLVIALLFLLRILSVDKFVTLFDLPDAGSFLRGLLWVGALLLLTELLVENAYIASLKKGLEQEHREITKLKAQLYDERMKSSNASLLATPGPAKPTASPLEQPPSTYPTPPNFRPDQNTNLPPRPDQRPLP